MKLRLAALLVMTMLGGCRHTGDIDEETQGVYAVRSTCPILGVPTGTGDITLFNPPNSTDSRAIDVTAPEQRKPPGPPPSDEDPREGQRYKDAQAQWPKID